MNPLFTLLDNALAARQTLFDERHEAAFRLFNGFLEGDPTTVIDLYGKTAVWHNYAKSSDEEPPIEAIQPWLLSQLPWLQCLILKTRRGDALAKRGVMLYGTEPDGWIREHGVRYALALTMNQDASLYLDTRQVRQWAIEQLAGHDVLNCFAYTGSLGVAAQAGGAAKVVHLDLNRQFLNVAKTSYTLNGFPINKANFQVGDFWSHLNRLKRQGARFDTIFLDPPFFSDTSKGRVDLARNVSRLINKVRPLLKDGGQVVAINNALFFSGEAYMQALQSLCADGYVRIVEPIPVPPDFTGYPTTRLGTPICDPTPFNHSTKIAVLQIRHKIAT